MHFITQVITLSLPCSARRLARGHRILSTVHFAHTQTCLDALLPGWSARSSRTLRFGGGGRLVSDSHGRV